MPAKRIVDNLQGFVSELFQVIVANESEQGHILFCRLVNDALDDYMAPWLANWTRGRQPEIEAAQAVFKAFKGTENRLPTFEKLIQEGTWHSGSFNTILFRKLIAAVPGYAPYEPKDEDTIISHAKTLLLEKINQFEREQKKILQMAKEEKEGLAGVVREEDSSSKKITLISIHPDVEKAKQEMASAGERAKHDISQTFFAFCSKQSDHTLHYFDPYGRPHALELTEGIKSLVQQVMDRQKKKGMVPTSWLEGLLPIEQRQLKIECICARDNFLRPIQLAYQKKGHEYTRSVFFLQHISHKQASLERVLSSMDGCLLTAKDLTASLSASTEEDEIDFVQQQEQFRQLLSQLNQLSDGIMHVRTEQVELAEHFAVTLAKVDFDPVFNKTLASCLDHFNRVLIEYEKQQEKFSRYQQAENKEQEAKALAELEDMLPSLIDAFQQACQQMTLPIAYDMDILKQLRQQQSELGQHVEQSTRVDKNWMLSYRDTHGHTWAIDMVNQHPKVWDFVKKRSEILDDERSQLKALLLDVQTARPKKIDEETKAALEACLGKKRKTLKVHRSTNPLDMSKYGDVARHFEQRVAERSEPKQTKLLDRELVASVAGLFGATVKVTKQYQDPSGKAEVNPDAPEAPPAPVF